MIADDAAQPVAPVWHDRRTYAYTQHLSRDAWAWEFLRRNPDYRAAWRRATAPPINRHGIAWGIATGAMAVGAASCWGLLPF